MIHIAKALEEGDIPLKVLSMTRNRIEVKAAEVGKAVATLKDLEELIMFQNGIKEEGMVGLLEGLKSLEKIRKIDLCDNWFLGKSMDLLCEMIQNNKSLVELNVGDCNLGKSENKRILAAVKAADKAWVGFGYNYNEFSDPKMAKELVTELVKGKKLKVSLSV